MPCDQPIYVQPKFKAERVPIPCGRCPPCKNRRVNSWVFRLMQEQKVSSSAFFVTLTYDTSSVPITSNGFMTLRKKDVQDYLKRLRKLCPGNTVKYYLCGEYGTKNKRPHYHMIVFNVPDRQMFADAWMLSGNSLGIVDVGTVTSDSVAYTMKYIDKPKQGKMHARDDRIPEFALMSKGLGASYLSDKVVQYHKSDIMRIYCVKEGGYRIALPRYYRERIYSKSEMNTQALKISDAFDEKQKSEMYRYSVDNPDGDYQQFKMWEKYGRQRSFNNRSLNNRNL